MMIRLASYLLVPLFLIAFVDASTSQLQMLLIGHVAIPEYVAKVGVFAVIVAYWAVSPKRRIDKWLGIAWIGLTATLAACASVVSIEGTIGFREQLRDLAVNYLYMLCLPLCFLCAKPFLRLDVILKSLALLAIPICFLGIAQYVLSEPLVATEAADGSFRVISWEFGDRVRAFSLFASSFAFSCYLAVLAGYFVAYLTGSGYSSKTRLLALGGCMLVAVTTYATITRLGFLFVLLAALLGILLSRVRAFTRLVWGCLPLIGLAVAALTLILAPMITSTASSDLVADASLIERLFHWAEAYQSWTNSGIAAFLCGTGVSQGSSNADYVVDNTFLNFAVQAGSLGLLASVAFMYTIWMSFRRAINRQRSPAVVALCAFWATWMLTGMINWTNPTYALVAAPFMISWEFP
jgi:hypothetical protein